MKRLALAVTVCAIAAAQPAAVEADLANRLRVALSRVPHPATRAEAEQARDALRAKLRAAIGMDRVAQPIRLTLFPSAALGPALIYIAAGCPERAGIYAQRGVTVACVEEPGPPTTADLLAGITPQGRLQYTVSRIIRYLEQQPNYDHMRLYLAGSGASATLAAALFPAFTRAAIDHPSINDEFIFDIAHFATISDLVALNAPRPLFLANAPLPLADTVRDHYHLFEAGQQLFTDIDHVQWLVQSAGNVPLPAAQIVDLPQETAFSDPPLPLQQLAGAPIPPGFMTMGLRRVRTQEIQLETQRGVFTPVTVFRPGPEGDNAGRGHLIAFADAGRSSLANDEIIREAVEKGWEVFAVDPRGIGAMKLNDADRAAITSFQLGEWFAWRQAADISRILEFTGQPSQDLRVAVYARGPNAALVASVIAATAPGSTMDWIAIREPAEGLPSLPVGPLAPFYPAFDLETLLRNPQPKVVLIRDPAEFLRQLWLIE